MEGAIKNILVPTDISRPSSQALKNAIGLARQCGAEVTLLYVVDLGLRIPAAGPAKAEHLAMQMKEEGAARLREIIQEWDGSKVEVRALVEEGIPREKICEAAQECDLIVLEKTRPKPFWHLFSRRTFEGLLASAPRPLLVVPANG